MSIDRDDRTRRGGDAAGRLTEQGVEGVALTFVDTAGITRVKAVPLERLGRAAGWGVGMSPVFDTFVSDDSITEHGRARQPRRRPAAAPGSGPAHRAVRAARLGLGAGRPLHPGRRAVRRLPAAVRPADGASARPTRGSPPGWRSRSSGPCRRGEATEEFTAACTGPAYGMTRLVELSDYAARPAGRVARAGRAGRAGAPRVLRRAVRGVGRAARPGRRRRPQRAGPADRSARCRRRHGLRVSFAPSVIAGHVGNGGHVHLSAEPRRREPVRRRRRPVRHDRAGRGRSPPACSPSCPRCWRSARPRWRATCGWCRRTGPACTPAGATRPARRRCGSSPAAPASEARVGEPRGQVVDLAANPYLLVGCAAGRRSRRASRPARPCRSPSGRPGPARRRRARARGHRTGCPRLSDAATDAFESSTVLREALGDVLADAVVAVRRGESRPGSPTRTPDEIAPRYAGSTEPNREDCDGVTTTRP